MTNLETEDPNDYARRRLDLGMEMQRRGFLEVAIPYYSEVIHLEQADPAILIDACNRRGECNLKKGDLQSAIKDFDRVLNEMPDHPDYASVYKNRGTAHLGTGSFDRAIEDFNKAIELKPDYPTAFRLRGIVYCRKGEYNTAIEDFSMVIALKPNYAKTYYNRGIAWLHLREWERAKSDLMNSASMKMDTNAAFRNDYRSVEDFEQRLGIQMPANIAAMLRRG